MKKAKILGWVPVTYLCGCFLWVLSGGPVGAYEFITDVKELHKSDGGHDKLTDLAYQCVLKNKGRMPANCLAGLPKITDRGINSDTYIEATHLNNDFKLPFTVEELIQGAVWPDDPTRQVKYSTFLKPSLNYLRSCGSDKDSITGGLYCNSHFGHLQFWHAMASSSTETYADTRDKILSWAWFSYGVATNKISLNENYCDYFYNLAKDDQGKVSRKGFAEAFLLSPDEKERDKQFHCSNNASLAFIYNNICDKPFSSGTCTVVHKSRELYMAALGAVLHLVQDAYSQSHANRDSCAGGNPGQASALINCTGIEGFYTYTGQSGKKHGVSDRLPVKVASSCLQDTTKPETRLHDPVTASAKVLWYAINGKDPSLLETYLDEHVFVRGDVITEASPGTCYMKTAHDDDYGLGFDI